MEKEDTARKAKEKELKEKDGRQENEMVSKEHQQNHH